MKNFVPSLVLVVAVFSQQLNAAELIGKAVDLDSGVPLYTERHVFAVSTGEGTLRSSYLTPGDEKFASRVVQYANNDVVEYRLEQSNIDYSERIERRGDELTIVVDKADTSPKTEQLFLRAGVEPVIDAGFNDYLVRNWDSLLKGERLRFQFASTAQLGLVKLQVNLDKRLSDNQIAVFSMTAANPVFRLLVEPVKVGFYRDSRQLAYYRGVSNLKDENGKAFDVEITFENNQLTSPQELAGR